MLVAALLLVVACAASSGPPPAAPAAPPSDALSSPPLAPKEEAPPAPAPAPEAAAPAEEPLPPKGPLSDDPKDWTDPRVVAKLAESCDYAPHPQGLDQGGSEGENIFACALPFEQTCFPNECDDASDSCRHTCESTCTSCSAACSSRCGACEKACKDGPCRLACAQRTAACKETCGHKMDHCGTAGCAAALATCNAALDRFWTQNRCEARCGVFRVCKGKCGSEAPACVRGCEEVVAPGYAACVDACSRAPGGAAGQDTCTHACRKSHPCAPPDCTRGEALVEGEALPVAARGE